MKTPPNEEAPRRVQPDAERESEVIDKGDHPPESGGEQGDFLRLPLSFYESVKIQVPRTNTCVADFVEAVVSDTYARKVAAIRELVEKGEGEAAKKLKSSLPAVSLSGAVTEGKRGRAHAEDRFKHSGLMQVDIDAPDNPDLDVGLALKEIARDPHVVCAFLSPSGNGVKAIVRIPADISRHNASFEIARDYFRDRFGLVIDEHRKDVGGLCFMSHDPNAGINAGAVEFEVPEASDNRLPSRPETSAKGRAADGGRAPRERGRDLTLEDLRQMLECITPEYGSGAGYSQWLKVVSGAFAEFGRDATPLLEAWAPCKPGELEELFNHRLERVGIGTVVWLAQKGGYQPPVRVRAAPPGISEERAKRLAECVDSGAVLRALGDEHRGLAELYAIARSGSRAYVHDEQRWRIYDSGVWEPDQTEETIDDLQSVITPFLAEAVNSKIKQLDSKEDEAEIKWLKKNSKCLLNFRKAQTVLENAAALPDFRSLRAAYDQSPHLLPIENGTIDFDQCKVRDHSPDDMLTVRAALVYDGGATCPAFDSFLDEVTCADKELAAFHLERMAYALTGYTWSDEMLFHYGDGANGKGTFTQTVRALFGNIFHTLDNRLLVGNREQASDEYLRASLEAARLTLADELPEGKRLRTDELKKLVGGDSITARQPYERQRTFKPTHKLWMCGNHKPEVGATDHGTWRRILLVPWLAKFSGEGPTRDERVGAFFEERGGILNRLLAAWRDVRDRGTLLVPDAVRSATAEYKTSSDQVGQFVGERCARRGGGSVALPEVLKTYHRWCAENGEEPSVKTSRKMSAELKRFGDHTRQGAQRKTFVADSAMSG